MSKAISTVIGTLLMLVITIGLFGFSYSYISGVFTSKTSETFYVVDALNDTITISNDGTVVITNIKATLDGNSVPIAVAPNIQGLVGHWSLNEGIGTTADDNSDNNNIGTLQPSCPNCPLWATGKFSTALQFDGVDDYVDIGTGFTDTIEGSGAITAWVYRTGNTGGIFARSTGGGWPDERLVVFFRSDTNEWGWSLSGGAGVQNPQWGISTFPADRWVHFSLVWDGSSVKTYLDGNKFDDRAQSEVPEVTGVKTRIGWTEGLAGQIFNGIIDEVYIYNRALSDSEITQLYSGLVIPGQLATVKPLATLTSGRHTLRLCTSSMCNTAVLHIQ